MRPRILPAGPVPADPDRDAAISPQPAALAILIIDDSEDDALILLRQFHRAGYAASYRRVQCADEMRAALVEQKWDAVLADHHMPRFSAQAALALMHELAIDLPFVIVSGAIDEETAVNAMRAGAHDYLNKNKLDRLVPAVEREVREARMRTERRAALDAVRESEARFRALAANIPGMVFQLLRTPERTLRFLFVSDGCVALLGDPPESLLADASAFLAQILSDDRTSLEAGLRASEERLALLNWEGRIRLADGTLKWINVRSSPRRVNGGGLLWEGIISNITQSKEAEAALRASRLELAELSSHLQVVKEEERERIAHDIHDELGSTLVAIKFAAALLAGKLPATMPQLVERARELERLSDDAIATASHVARELRPGILKEFGLPAALECHAEDFAQRTGIECRMQHIDYDIDCDDTTAVALFRVFQEALTNIAKHAGASRVEVRLNGHPDELGLEILDNGRGVSSSDFAKPRSFGVRGMRERVHHLGGRFLVEPRPEGGTRLSLSVPIAPPATP
ncbi:MAG: hypothetical protein AMXMBFR6_19320 [Betaproteobacteria bacterium]